MIFMELSWKEWKRNDIIWGIIIPLLIVLLIMAFPVVVGPGLHNINTTLESIFVAGLEEAILIVAFPMMLGLLWNQWAGGAAGFLLGSIYSLATFQMYGLSGSNHFFLLGYVMSAMLIGYIAGALNKGSFSFRRMLVAGLVSAIIGGLFLYFTMTLPGQPIIMVAPDYAYSMFLTIVPRIIYGILIPFIASLFKPIFKF